MIAVAICAYAFSWQGPPVTVGPSIFSLAELATALSKDGRHVDCGPAIANRAAVVSLRERNWEDARRILATALGISFHQESESSWLMDLSPDAKAAERRAFDQWVAATNEAVRSVLARAQQIMPDWSRANLRTKDAELEEMTMAARDSGDDLTKSAAGLLANLGSSYRVDPLFPFALSDGDGIGALVKQDCVAYGTGSTGNRSNYPDWAIWTLPSGSSVCSVDRISLDPVSGSVITSNRRSSGPNSVDPRDYRWTVAADFDWLNSRLSGAKEEDGTQMLQALPSAISKALDVTTPLKGFSRSTAEAMARWSANSHVELVMEVSSIRDELPVNTRIRESATGKDLLWARGLGRQNLFDLLHPQYDPLAPSQVTELDRELALIKLHPWVLSSVDSALVVRNRFSFLDHQFKVPFSKLLELRAKETLSGDFPDSVPLSAVLAYCASTSLEENTSVARNLPPLAPPFLGEFYPFGRLLSTLSPEKRLHLLMKVQEAGRATLPLASFSSKARDTFERSLQELALKVGDRFWQAARPDNDAMLLHPDFDAELGNLNLVFEFKSSGSSIGSLIASLQIPGAESSNGFITLVEVRLGKVALTPQY